MPGKFEITKDKRGEYRFRLKQQTGRPSRYLRATKPKASAYKGIDSVKTLAADAPVVDTTDLTAELDPTNCAAICAPCNLRKASAEGAAARAISARERSYTRRQHPGLK